MSARHFVALAGGIVLLLAGPIFGPILNEHAVALNPVPLIIAGIPLVAYAALGLFRRREMGRTLPASSPDHNTGTTSTRIGEEHSIATEVKNSGVGIVLSFFWTGLGQLYAGRVARGLLMMFATPFIWAAAWFGGGTSLLFGGGTALLATDASTPSDVMATGGVMTIVGGAFLIGGFVWWIWGMLDARKLCEAFNAGARPRPSTRP